MTYNRIKLIGHVGAMPFVKYTSPTTCISRFSLATNRDGYIDDEGRRIVGERTDWHSILCFNDLAEIVEAEVRTGSKVEVEGYLTYEDRILPSGERIKAARIEADVLRVFAPEVEEELPEVKEEKPTHPYGKYLDTLSQDADKGGLPF